MKTIDEIQDKIASELAFHSLGGYEVPITKVLELMLELAECIEKLTPRE